MANALKRFFGGGRDATEVVTSYRVAAQHRDLGVPEADLSRLAFIHHTTSIFNLGDYLSSPRHYFRFVPPAAGKPIAVIGGGVFGNYDAVRKNIVGIDLAARRRIGWGVGLSVKSVGTRSSKMDAFSNQMDFNATRDPDLATEEVRFCPCSSVFNAITELPPGREVGILLNHSPKVSGADPLRLNARYAHLAVGGNALSENDFRAIFSRIGHIVTNSYHTAMWGLLSGRSVGVIGFSSKYANVLKMFGIAGDYQHCEKGDTDGLVKAIDRVIGENLFVAAPNASERREEFRQLNLAYARNLVEQGVFERIDLVPDDQRALDRRTAEVFQRNVLVEVSK
jgi:hypothetical protein